jgi:hypothetical protein
VWILFERKSTSKSFKLETKGIKLQPFVHLMVTANFGTDTLFKVYLEYDYSLLIF